MSSGISAIRGSIATLFALGFWLAACTEQGTGQAHHPAGAEPLRLVSLSPAISRTLVDLGLSDRLVGRSRFCRAVDPAIPVVGDLTHIDYERLIRLKPTHLLLQPPLAGLDPELTRLAEEQSWSLGVWPSLNGVEDIEQLLSELPDRLYTRRSTESRETRRRVAETLHAMNAALSRDDGDMFRGRTLILSGLEPVMAFGRDTYMDDILTRLGASNTVTARGWVQLSFEDVVRMDPEAIVLVLDTIPGSSPPPSEILQPLESLRIAAVRNQRLTLLAHPDALLPSSGVIGVADALRGLLRQLARAPNQARAETNTG